MDRGGSFGERLLLRVLVSRSGSGVHHSTRMAPQGHFDHHGASCWSWSQSPLCGLVLSRSLERSRHRTVVRHTIRPVRRDGAYWNRGGYLQKVNAIAGEASGVGPADCCVIWFCISAIVMIGKWLQQCWPGKIVTM